MKLLGVEIVNYACFQRQFVPIREGVNLLVGKNNSGKTALLKALGAFSALQMANRPYTSQETRKFVNQMTGYLHAAESMDAYEANVLFEVERGDSLTIAGDQELWNAFVTEHRTLARYSLLFMPRQSEDQVIFRSAQLEIEGQAPLIFLESNDKGFLFHAFELEEKGFKKTGTGHIGSNGRSIYGPDAKHHWVQLPSSDYFNPLLPLLGCSYVAAHRVSAPSVDIQTAESLPHNAENLPVFLQTLHGNKRRAFAKSKKWSVKYFQI